MTLSPALFSSKQEDYQTPKWLYDKLNKIFSFNLDPCTSRDNPLGTKYFFTKQIDGLAQSWDLKSIYINPPYGRDIRKWLSKAYNSLQLNPDQVIVMLLPARTDTKWFHQYIYKQPNVEVRFLKGRLRFENTQSSAPFPSMVVILASPLFHSVKIQQCKTSLTLSATKRVPPKANKKRYKEIQTNMSMKKKTMMAANIAVNL